MSRTHSGMLTNLYNSLSSHALLFRLHVVYLEPSYYDPSNATVYYIEEEQAKYAH